MKFGLQRIRASTESGFAPIFCLVILSTCPLPRSSLSEGLNLLGQITVAQTSDSR